ncbi:hypothetical protein Goarm_018143, partial [Gossypium armourianum]|nr:hypothetical protein [Gossypium armourianum]
SRSPSIPLVFSGSDPYPVSDRVGTGEDDKNEIGTENTAFVHGKPPQDAAGPPKVESDKEIVDENEIVTENTAFVHGEPPQDAAGPPKVESDMEILHEKMFSPVEGRSNSLPLLRWGSTSSREVFEVLSSETPTCSFNNERYIVLQGRVYGTNLANEKFLKCCLLGSQWILQQKTLYQCTRFTEWKRLDWWRYNLQELKGE